MKIKLFEFGQDSLRVVLKNAKTQSSQVAKNLIPDFFPLRLRAFAPLR
jgi:hypothetical protein